MRSNFTVKTVMPNIELANNGTGPLYKQEAFTNLRRKSLSETERQNRQRFFFGNADSVFPRMPERIKRFRIRNFNCFQNPQP
jgi:hypothetical protein